MKRGTTVYLYELAWILPSFAIPVGMLVALVVTAFGAGVHLPGNEGRVDPRTVGQTGPFAEPGVVQIAPGQCEVRMTAQIWSFTPGEIRVPVGSTVHFWAELESDEIEHRQTAASSSWRARVPTHFFKRFRETDPGLRPVLLLPR